MSTNAIDQCFVVSHLEKCRRQHWSSLKQCFLSELLWYFIWCQKTQTKQTGLQLFTASKQSVWMQMDKATVGSLKNNQYMLQMVLYSPPTEQGSKIMLDKLTQKTYSSFNKNNSNASTHVLDIAR